MHTCPNHNRATDLSATPLVLELEAEEEVGVWSPDFRFDFVDVCPVLFLFLQHSRLLWVADFHMAQTCLYGQGLLSHISPPIPPV